jgi:hypothetical protein
MFVSKGEEFYVYHSFHGGRMTGVEGRMVAPFINAGQERQAQSSRSNGAQASGARTKTKT